MSWWVGGSLRTCSFSFFSLGAAAAAAAACCCCCPHQYCKRREMLGTSIAAVVRGCFYLCPVDCDASVMVVDCAAVDTGCMLEK